MSDDSDFWSDVGQIVWSGVLAAGAFALQGALSPQVKAEASTPITQNEPRPYAINFVGDYSRSGGAYAWYDAANGSYAAVVAVSKRRLNDYLHFYLGDNKVTVDPTDGRVTTVDGTAFGGVPYMDDPARVFIHSRLGLPTETAYSQVVTRFPGRWTTAHRGDDTASVALVIDSPKPEFRAALLPNGIPRVGVVGRGRCYDWRDGSQARLLPETWKPSKTPVVWAVHLEWTEFGKPWDRFIAPVLSDLTVEANYCDEAVALAAGGTEPRFVCAGNYPDNWDKAKVRQLIINSMSAYYGTDSLGRLVIRAGRYLEPDVTFTADDIDGVTYGLGQAEEDIVNELSVSYMSAAHNYNVIDADPWLRDSGGKADSLVLSWVPSHRQARYCGKIRFAELGVRPIKIITSLSGVAALDSSSYPFIRVQYPKRPGMADIVVKVMSGPQIDVMNDRITWDVRQVVAETWSWTTAEEGLVPPTPSTPSVVMPVPTITTATPFYDPRGARISLAVSGPSRSDLSWVYRLRIAGETAWEPYRTDTNATGGSTTVQTQAVSQDVSIEIQVAYRTGAGRLSPLSATTTVTTSSAAIAPEVPTNFSASGGSGQIIASWRNPNSLNLNGVRLWRGTVGTPFSVGTYTDISGLKTGLGVTVNHTATSIPPGSYDVWVTSENAAGTRSAPVGPVTVTVT